MPISSKMLPQLKGIHKLVIVFAEDFMKWGYLKFLKTKETNRQIGPKFGNWLKRKSLGIEPINLNGFLNSSEKCNFRRHRRRQDEFCKKQLNYNRNIGLDLVARFNGKYVLGEAKFLSSDGGSQNSGFEDAIATIEAKDANTIKVAILDGIL